MEIETVIAIIVGLGVIGIIYKSWSKKTVLDVNQDGKVDAADAKAAVEVVAVKVVEEVKAVEAKVEEVYLAKKLIKKTSVYRNCDKMSSVERQSSS